MTASPGHCACCGQAIPPALVLPPMMARVYDFVRRNPGCTRDQIADHVYADDPSGGPEAVHIISAHVWHLNKRLRPHGLLVRSTKGRGANYRIVELRP